MDFVLVVFFLFILIMVIGFPKTLLLAVFVCSLSFFLYLVKVIAKTIADDRLLMVYNKTENRIEFLRASEIFKGERLGKRK